MEFLLSMQYIYIYLYFLQHSGQWSLPIGSEGMSLTQRLWNEMALKNCLQKLKEMKYIYIYIFFLQHSGQWSLPVGSEGMSLTQRLWNEMALKNCLQKLKEMKFYSARQCGIPVVNAFDNEVQTHKIKSLE